MKASYARLDEARKRAFARALQQMLSTEFEPAIPQVGYLVNSFQELQSKVASVCYKLEHLS